MSNSDKSQQVLVSKVTAGHSELMKSKASIWTGINASPELRDNQLC